MLLLEYEAKTLLRRSGLTVPRGTVVTPESDLSALTTPVVLKSQVPVGGRGKLGGVVVVEDQSDIPSQVSRLFTLAIKDFTPDTLLAEEKIIIEKEFYVSLVVDRESASIRLIAHAGGGVEIETNDLMEFFNTPITDANIQIVATDFSDYLDIKRDQGIAFIDMLYTTFAQNDAILLEINPLIITKSGQLVCGDCKMELDDAASFRHPDWNFSQKQADSNFVVLNKDGSVATIANGAGLAMATVDAVAASGMIPANFLDIGGGASADSILDAFRQIAEFPSVKAIVVNIFAGITRCDEVARAIIAAQQKLPGLPPLFIRLAGTNSQMASELLRKQGLQTLTTLDECLTSAKGVV